MANLNPLQLMSLVKGGNPYQIVQQLVQQYYSNNPSVQQLFALGQKGDVDNLKQIAQQICSQQGKDFETEMNNLMKLLK